MCVSQGFKISRGHPRGAKSLPTRPSCCSNTSRPGRTFLVSLQSRTRSRPAEGQGGSVWGQVLAERPVPRARASRARGLSLKRAGRQPAHVGFTALQGETVPSGPHGRGLGARGAERVLGEPYPLAAGQEELRQTWHRLTPPGPGQVLAVWFCLRVSGALPAAHLPFCQRPFRPFCVTLTS